MPNSSILEDDVDSLDLTIDSDSFELSHERDARLALEAEPEYTTDLNLIFNSTGTHFVFPFSVPNDPVATHNTIVTSTVQEFQVLSAPARFHNFLNPNIPQSNSTNIVWPFYIPVERALAATQGGVSIFLLNLREVYINRPFSLEYVSFELFCKKYEYRPRLRVCKLRKLPPGRIQAIAPTMILDSIPPRNSPLYGTWCKQQVVFHLPGRELNIFFFTISYLCESIQTSKNFFIKLVAYKTCFF